MQSEYKQDKHRILHQVGTTVFVVVGAAAMLLGILGGFWMYNELLNMAWNMVFGTSSPSSSMLGLSLFSAVGLGAGMFKLHQWLNASARR